MIKHKNYGKSVRTRLLTLMNKTGYRYMYLLTRYFNERLLYRVSVSQYKENFLLKGGSLLYALQGLESRPTVDIDFLADRISRDRDYLTSVFKEILSIDCEMDGVKFDTDELQVEPITVDKKYPGTRFHFTAHMDSIVQKMSIDIGFGDVVTPYPMNLDYPLLLPDVPSVNLKAYSIETVIAEKFHTMLDRDVFNSRMKDFFDCYQLFVTYKIDHDSLYQAINATFSNRKLEYNADRKLFTESFATDEERNINWNRFLKQINFKQELPFPKVMDLLRDELLPMENKYWQEHDGVKL